MGAGAADVEKPPKPRESKKVTAVSEEDGDVPKVQEKKKPLDPTKSKHESRRAARRRHFENMVHKEPEAALAYLQAWEKRDSESGWKFNKATQAWILRHVFKPDHVSKESFQIVLPYIEGMQGAARERTLERAGVVYTLQGAPLADQDEDTRNKSKKEKKREDKAQQKEQKENAQQKEKKEKAQQKEKNREEKAQQKATKSVEVGSNKVEMIGEPDGDSATKEAPVVDAEALKVEMKARKRRMRRAQMILASLGDPRGLEDDQIG